MKKIFILVTVLTLGGLQYTCAQVLRSMTPRYNNPSVKGNIVFVANNIITSVGAGTSEVPPGGSQVNNGKPGENIDIDTKPTFFTFGSTWKYLDNNTRPAGWETSGFADGAWASAPAMFGYGDGDVVTTINYGPDPNNKYVTTYFRKSITVTDPTDFQDFTMNVYRDDGIVVYVNGVEVVRDNMPTGTILHSTLAPIDAADGGDAINTFTIPSSAFSAGTNVIAVEVHQVNATSHDLVFDMELIGNPLTTVTFIPFLSNWKYLDNNTRPAGWETSGFADGAWASGGAALGYDDPKIVTCVRSSAAPVSCTPTGNKYITTYFRKAITIADPTIFNDFTMNVYRDDGIVVYVNGVEVVRNNMPGGPINHNTVATTFAADDGDAINKFIIPAAAFAAGTNVIAVEVHQSSVGSSDLVFDMELIGNLQIATLIPYGGTWRYLDNDTRPAGWEASGFADGAWKLGDAKFGYEDPVTTVVFSGCGTSNYPLPENPKPGGCGPKYITTYFRKQVTIPNVSLYGYYIINLVRDDGAVIYINGVEVVRENLPTGTIVHSTLALTAIGGASETTPVSYIIPASAFVNGVNTIAVEMHQINNTSTDLSFDLELLGSKDSTFNSSSADLTLPSCSQVLFAGLYWGASQGTNGTNLSWIHNEDKIKLKIPGASSYQDVIATQIDYHNGTLVPGLPHTGYRSFADITSLVNATAANGTYVIGNVASPAGIDNTSAGWTIVIAYSDPATIVRNLTVFDGSVIMNGGDPPLHIPITGFLTPPSGPVSCELGAVVYDGDRTSIDEYSFKQDANPLVGTYTSLTPNATANLNDMWNSTISYKGATVTTRSPMHYNTLGFDADILDLPNVGNAVLGNSQNSASVRFSSPSENYMLQVATTAISQYTPTFHLRKSAVDVNGGSLAPGDVIRYQIDFQNLGNDASVSTVLFDNIPLGTSYVPGSLKINTVAKTDALTDDEADYDFVNNRVVFRLGTGADGTSGGEVASGISGSITFEVYTPSSCAVFACNNTIRNRAGIQYGGKLSGISLADSSGVELSGCVNPTPVTNTISGTCRPLGDTILTNTCPATNVTIPVARYAGYYFYTGFPFIPANRYNPAVPVTTTRIIYAFYDGPGTCDDTIRLNIFITGCPDIDDDKDGLPDYLELRSAAAIADQDGDGIPNWADNTPGSPILWVDNNVDNINDYYDPGADVDNDGIPNFYDTDYMSFTDSNGDGVNDNLDKDLDGIPDYLDLDSDNDGIPDTVESFGVDANGDGRIDNFIDSDVDGLSDNVDANTSGANSLRLSGLGLGALDTDADGIPNYLDLDSDNDGIPDIIEAFGTDVANSAMVSGFTDTDGDGYDDALDADVGNDDVAENSTSSLLRTGADGNNDGRTDTWPYKNFDNDSKPNAYDLDSDGDGITDVKEAGFTDANWDGRVDGAVNSNGRNSALAALGSLTLPNNDGTGRVNIYDIDSDDDGIPDNVEGLPTTGYLLPSGLDTDGDGIDNAYDNNVGFGGDGIHPVDTDSDTIPDYLDSDTDSDGVVDIIEGNDLNLNGLPDDLVTLTGVDTDGDGLDDRFDNNNSSVEATSAYMGNGGSTSGDPTPGSITTVQHTSVTYGCPVERDWRCLPYMLSCEFITFKAVLQTQQVRLNWTALCRQEVDYFIVERSTDRVNFINTVITSGKPVLNEAVEYSAIDNVSGVPSDIFYYRLTSVMKSGRKLVSNIITVKRNSDTELSMKILPNPVKEQLQLIVNAPQAGLADISIIDGTGRSIYHYKEELQKGNNSIIYPVVAKLQSGMYYIRLQMEAVILTEKFNKLK